jgi:anti-sigma B factor antagonist
VRSRAAIEIREVPQTGITAVLRVRGILDAASAQPLIARCGEIQAEGRNLVLDLSEVSFLASGGIGALLVLSEQFQEQGGAVRFAALSASAASVVKLINLDRILGIDDTVEGALTRLAA